MLFVNTIPIRTLVAVAALVATGAFAEVTIGGNIDQGYTTMTGITIVDGVATAVNGARTSGLTAAHAANFINFSGSEDLGSGLKASFKFESGLAFNNGNVASQQLAAAAGTGGVAGGLFSGAADGTTGSNREAWVALSGAFGALTLGNQYTNAFNTLAAIDPMGVNNIVGLGALSPLAGANGALTAVNRTNVINYHLPKFVEGLGVTYQRANATSALGNGSLDNTQNPSSSLGLTYDTGAFHAGYANDSTGGNNAQYYGVSYDFGIAKVGYTNSNRPLAAAQSSKDEQYSISAPVTEAVKLGYSAGQSKVALAATTTIKNQQFGAYYSLSKRTTAYFIYGTTSTPANAINMNSFGINHAF